MGVIALFQSDTGVVSIGIVGSTAHGISVNRVDWSRTQGLRIIFLELCRSVCMG
jgi:hypothetical protein